MTIRFKLTMGFLAVILLLNALLSLIAVKHVSQVWLREVQNRVKLDLNSAREVYRCDKQRIARFLEGAAFDTELARHLQSGDCDELGRLTRQLHSRAGVDMMSILGPDGHVLCRAQEQSSVGDDMSANPLVAQAAKEHTTAIGTIIISREQLEREGGDLAKRAEFALVPTAATRPTDNIVHGDGMAAAVAVPVMSGDGRLLGLLYGANLVNRRFELVDAIRNQVFPPMRYGGKEVGTVTIFQADVRISTNVVGEDGRRAVGTRMSDAVRQKVLVQGEIFADRALVVNDWYITAYEPICDPSGKIIGAMYVGLLEAPFSAQHNLVIAGFLFAVGATSAAHEINNPLTGVPTFAHVLREKSNMDDQDRQDLDLIIHETTRVGEIVTGLLDFARERPAAKVMLDLNQVIRQTIRLVANQPRFEKSESRSTSAKACPRSTPTATSSSRSCSIWP